MRWVGWLIDRSSRVVWRLICCYHAVGQSGCIWKGKPPVYHQFPWYQVLYRLSYRGRVARRVQSCTVQRREVKVWRPWSSRSFDTIPYNQPWMEQSKKLRSGLFTDANGACPWACLKSGLNPHTQGASEAHKVYICLAQILDKEFRPWTDILFSIPLILHVRLSPTQLKKSSSYPVP